MYLSAGAQTLRVYATGSGFNLNWIHAVQNTGGNNNGSKAATIYDFEGSSQDWNGSNISAGPWSVNEWSSKGNDSLKADINMSSSSKHYLLLTQSRSLSGKSKLSADAKHASWGSTGDGLYARIYVKTGSGWAWYAGDSMKLNSSGSTTLTINLASIPHLDDVREIGVEYISSMNSSGQTSVYLDNVTIQ